MQHLLGMGHLMRGTRVAKALAAEAFDVTLVVGGIVPPGLDVGTAHLVHLPPVKAGPGGFADLVGPDGTPFGLTERAARRDRLLDAFADCGPDVLMTEAFPFGRRQMRFELLPLLRAAAAMAAPPLVAASVRDILQQNRKPGRDAESVALLQACFDLAVVHGDPALATLADSFPLAASIADRIAYSGLVGPEASHPDAKEAFDVVVSVGGGAVGGRLIDLALAARPLSRLAAARWLVLTGPNHAGGERPPAPEGVTLRPFVGDLPARLRCARLSISQAGYNTVADLLGAPACRAVLVPHAAGGETEQTRRADLMAARGWATAVPDAGLDAATLAQAIDTALMLPERPATIALDGAARTAAILSARLAAPARVLADPGTVVRRQLLLEQG